MTIISKKANTDRGRYLREGFIMKTQQSREHYGRRKSNFGKKLPNHIKSKYTTIEQNK